MRRLILILALLVVPLVTAPPAHAGGRTWPRCYVSGNWRYQVCHCGATRYPMWFCTRQAKGVTR